MRSAGYSKTPLSKKLGFKEGYYIKLINVPVNYHELIEYWDLGQFNSANSSGLFNVIHIFSKSADELGLALTVLKKEIEQNGMIWVSWPKKASKVETDITEDVVRHAAFKNKLVDVKVCAIDDVWSGLK